MSRGYPDWGVDTGAFGAFDIDSAELAARLESIVTYDRLGKVALLDKCDDSLSPWGTSTAGAGASVALNATESYRHHGSIELTAGSDGAASAWIYHNIPLVNLSKVGSEITWRPLSAGHMFYTEIRSYDGTNQYEYYVIIHMFSDEIQVWHDASVITKVDDALAFETYTEEWHKIKLVVDLANNKYVRLRIDDTTYDLSAYGPVVSANAAVPFVQVTFRNVGPTGNNPEALLNDFIFTIDEP